jgi:Flp pilus assembly protein TadG
MLAIGMATFIVLVGVSIDLGHVYYAIQQLQASTNAAALAGASGLPDTDTAAAYVVAYSSVPANSKTGQAQGKNSSPSLTNVSLAQSTFECSQQVSTILGIPCVATTGSNAGLYNAMIVRQTAQVPLWFASVLGIPVFNIGATATAAMAGPAPYNIALVMDTTTSMANTDDSCGSGVTAMQCSLQGAQELLYYLYPCSPALTTCTFSKAGQADKSVDRVAVFAVPNVSLSTVALDSSCGNTTVPDAQGYTYPLATAISYQPTGSTPTYEVSYNLGAGENGFFSDYRTADQLTINPPESRTLNNNSLLVKLLGGVSTCHGLKTPNNASSYGTWYAGAIYAAQAALTAEHLIHSEAANVMIILTDGQANAGVSSYFSPSLSNTNGTYPSIRDACQQAIVAAQAATKAQTAVYAIAYGSEPKGCFTSDTGSPATDTKLVATGKNVAFTLSTLTPCMTMENLSSDYSLFFSDYSADYSTGSSSTCLNTKISTNNNSLQAIFKAIAGGLGAARLVPNGTT